MAGILQGIVFNRRVEPLQPPSAVRSRAEAETGHCIRYYSKNRRFRVWNTVFFSFILPIFPQYPYLCSPNLVIMFAIVKIAGQQFKVQKDQTLYVPHLGGNAGDQVEFADVLLASADGKLSVGSAVKTTIKAEILDQVQGDKVIAFKMKRRKGFRKKHGHRTQYTKIKVTDIV